MRGQCRPDQALTEFILGKNAPERGFFVGTDCSRRADGQLREQFTNVRQLGGSFFAAASDGS